MIPRLHPRGTSFKGACSYVLHDAGQKTAERVEWTLSRNLGSPDIRDSWFEMMQTWQARGLLKQAAGFDARGRDNWKPVLHYTLSWHADDKPTPEHMRKAAIESLKALGLSEHEAVIAAHNDKQHMHVHIVVNTVHPQTGMTAPMKFTKLELSKWAEAYEREHGIHCDERVRNNEERRRLAAERDKEALAILTAAANRQPLPKKRAYVPVKDESPNRRQWFERKEITDRMKRLRAEMEIFHKIDRNTTWERQRKERDAFDANTDAAIDQAKEYVRKQFRPQWRELYQAQKRELKFLEKEATHPLARAVYIFSQRERLGRGTPLGWRSMLQMIRKPGKLLDRVDAIHERERRELSQSQRSVARVHVKKILDAHTAKFKDLRSRQTEERRAERDAQWAKTRTITLDVAKSHLIQERESLPQPPIEPRPVRRAPAMEPPAKDITPTPAGPDAEKPFNEAARGQLPAGRDHPGPTLAKAFDEAANPPAKLSRAEQIRRDMEEWRKRNPDRDTGREL